MFIKKIKIIFIITTLLYLLSFAIKNVKADTWKYYMPGYFGNDQTIHAYEWIDSQFLDQLQVTLDFQVSSGIGTFLSQPKSYEDMYTKIIDFYKGYNFGFMQKKADKIINDPIAKDIFITYGTHILAREHGGNKEQNPRNAQGCYQIVAIQSLYNNCFDSFDDKRRSLFSCDKVRDIYKPLKLLSEKEQIMQAMDLLMYISDTMPYMEKRLNKGYDDPFSYRSNFLIWMRAVLKNRYSDEDLKKYIDAIILNDTNKIVELLTKESKTFSSIGINNIEGFSKWKLYARTAVIAGTYNGWGNNYGLANNKKVYNILDHAYVSNFPAYNIFFKKISRDFSSNRTIDKQKGFLQTYFESINDPNAAIEYATLLKILKENGDLRGSVNNI